MNNDNLIVHFGCRGQARHYLTFPSGRMADERTRDRELNLPRLAELDCSWAFLSRPEEAGHGALTYLPTLHRTVLAWWGSPYDLRGKANQAVIAAGRLTMDELWARFVNEFPDLAHLARPVLVATYDR